MRKAAYLTIDDGPGEDTACKIRVLATMGIQAIWFCRGTFIEHHPRLAKDIIVAGHLLANHSYDHPYFSRLSIKECQDQIVTTENIIDAAYTSAGITRPALHCFRFPWGDKGTGNGLDAFACSARGAAGNQLATLQAFLNERGFRQPAFEPVTHAWYTRASLDKDFDTYWTLDPGEWRLLSKNPKHRLSSIDEVIGNIKHLVSSSPPASPEIVAVHDFHETRETFVPILEEFGRLGIAFTRIPSIA